MKTLLFALLLMGLSVEAQVVDVTVYQDCSLNGDTIDLTEPNTATGSASVLSTAGRTSCEYVQLWAGGPKWATFNVGATITDYANLTVGKETTPYFDNREQASYYNTANVGGLYAWNQPNYNGRKTTWSYSAVTGISDVATALWGSNWKSPTQLQLDTLRNSRFGKTIWTWCDGTSTQYVPGCRLSGYKVSGVGAYADKSIFLPAAGCFFFYDGEVCQASTRANYWSGSMIVNSPYAYFMFFESTTSGLNYDDRRHGLSVRAVLVESTVIIQSEGCATQQTVIANNRDTLCITPLPIEGYYFSQWSDGVTDNPRLVTITSNVTYTAQYAPAAPTDVEHVDGVNKYVNTITKVVRDGHVLIQRGDRIYDLRGQEVQ